MGDLWLSSAPFPSIEGPRAKIVSMASKPPKKGVHILIKLFVILHVAGITIWALPNPRRPIMVGSVEPFGPEWLLYYNWRYVKNSPVRYYLVTTGAWQYWDMFSPNPSSTDFWGDAEVIYQDGTTKHYPYPRMYSLPIPVKYFKERFRKFFERAGGDDFKYVWPAFAQRVALDMDTMAGNPPVRVKLFRHFQKLDSRKEVQQDYETYMYYEHLVDQEALKTAKESL